MNIYSKIYFFIVGMTVGSIAIATVYAQALEEETYKETTATVVSDVSVEKQKYPKGIYNEKLTPQRVDEAREFLKQDTATYEVTRRLDRIIEILEKQ